MADEAGTTVEKTYVIPVPLEHPDPDVDAPTIVMRPLDEGAWAVFSRIHEQLKVANRMAEAQRVQFAVRNVALIMQSLELSIPDESDRVWIDGLILSGELTAVNAMGLVSEVARQHFATEADNTAPTTGPVRLVR